MLQPLTRPQSLSGTGKAPGYDGIDLFYRFWLPETAPSHALILFHGGHEHSGRFGEIVERLSESLPECAFFAWDARGHGQSPGKRGDAGHFEDLVRDADSFVHAISAVHSIALEDMAVLGHSVGSVVVATWLLDFVPPVRAAVLSSPAFDVKLYVPFARTGLKLMQWRKPDAQINSYVRPSMLTHDQAEARARSVDHLISPRISVRVLTSLYATAERVIANAAGIRTPVQILSAGSDHVVHRRAQRQFFEALDSEHKELHLLPGFYHEVFHEQERELPLGHAARFLGEAFARGRIGPGTDRIEPAGSDRFESLSRPLPVYSLRRWAFGISRLAMGTVGRLSKGVSLGWETGFESGRSLDHVYTDQAQGIGSLGRAMDRLYLDSPGWRGIRTRALHLKEVLSEEITRRRKAGRRVHVLDVAGGPGRYLIETLSALDDPGVTAQCRDLDEGGLAQGRALTRELDVRGLLHVRADAFDPRSYRDLVPRPDVVVVSGLFELFDDNTLLSRALAAIHEALPADGSLIVTNQPHHPQLEFIARVLNDRFGRPWVMRLRPQVELEGLLQAAGYITSRRRIDDEGIFSVNLARKESRS